MTEITINITPDTNPETARCARFCALIESHIEAVSRFVHALVRNREEARDIVSDTMLAAFEKEVTKMRCAACRQARSRSSQRRSYSSYFLSPHRA
jgi:DNA-directed RNA polymerase specialized sigma24 family protein